MHAKLSFSNRLRKYRGQLVTAGAAWLLALPLGAQAGGVVTNCTEAALRAAMAGGGVVTFACDGTITLASTITNAVNTVVDGTGHQVRISGGNAGRVFWVGAGATLALVNLTIANGAGSGGAGILNAGGTVYGTNCTFSDNTARNQDLSTVCGGAILNGSGPIPGGLIRLVACNFVRNQVLGFVVGGLGGAGAAGGAIYSSGTVILDLCTFGDNLASGAPGTWQPGVQLGGSGSGGAIFNSGTLEVRRTTFAGNVAYGAAAGPGGMPGAFAGDGNGGAICNRGTLWLDSSTLQNNATTGGAGGTGADGHPWMDIATDGGAGGTGGLGGGGGLFNSGTATAVNCTFAANSGAGGQGGTGGTGGTGQRIGGNGGPGGTGGAGFGAIYDTSGLCLTNCTLASNAGSPGSGGAGGMGGGHLSPSGWDGGPGPPGTSGVAAGGIRSMGCLLVNAILATNFSNCYGLFGDGGHNLSSDASCAFTGAGSLNNVDPKLGPLANNGGPTLTMALLSGSPAIDAGNTSLAPTTDQRGFPRPAGLAADMGAVEYGSVMPALVVSRSGTNGLNLLGTGNAGQSCRLLSSSNLTNWLPIATNQIGTNGTVLFYDTCAPGGACRFYRLVMP